MKPLYKSLRESIESGDYFQDSRNWYKYKYIYPFAQRSLVLILSAIIFVIFFGVVLDLYALLPIVSQVNYSIATDYSQNSNAKIIHANRVPNSPLISIADIMLRNYVKNREHYSYSGLKKQFIFVKNNSTRIVFRRFYNSMNIDNPLSPVMRYQKTIQRQAMIISTHHPFAGKSIVKFATIAQSPSRAHIENIVWQATISYEIDKINTASPSGTRFNFTVTDYKLKLLENKNAK
ncbi:MAG: virB8 family protein [Rickettsiales bacterium]|nr:MAG: virB8 family protein [Rickettsiales bacterium]